MLVQRLRKLRYGKQLRRLGYSMEPHRPVVLSGDAARRAEEILARREKAQP